VLPASLQASVERFARPLEVPSRLIKLHPRRRGNPGNAAALAPAITLGVTSAFEGFAEDFLAVVLSLRGQSFGQIAKRIGNTNNPTVKDFANALIKEMPALKSVIGVDFALTIWLPPRGTSWWREGDLTWNQALDLSEAWMQVRHCLSHGLASGWRAEYWPAPTKDVPAASTVLRSMPGGKHSLTLHGAISCARLYTECARHISHLVANELGQRYAWTAVPEFHLHSARAENSPP